jgi:superfamily II RNA helicase
VIIGRSGKRLVLVTGLRECGVAGLREDGRPASFPLERIGRVFEPIFSTKPGKIDEAFDEIHERGPKVALPEPRLRDVALDEQEAVRLIGDLIDSLTPAHLSEAERAVAVEAMWSVQEDAEAAERAERQIESLRNDVWEPFKRCARVLDHFGYLDFSAERVTERGRWLADLHVDRPLLVGEALQRGLLASLDETRVAALVAALAADEDRDYGEMELDDAIVTMLVEFEQIAFDVSTEEWKQGIDSQPEMNFSAAAAAAQWVNGVEWSALVRETRAEEGDIVRLLSRTGEALLQVAGLRESHPPAANTAAKAAARVLREPVR